MAQILPQSIREFERLDREFWDKKVRAYYAKLEAGELGFAAFVKYRYYMQQMVTGEREGVRIMPPPIVVGAQVAA